MAQLVFEFVAQDLNAVLMAAEPFVGATPKSCEIAHTFLNYEPCATFEDAISKIRAREAVSAVFRPEGLTVRYVLINEPQFDGAKIPGWSAQSNTPTRTTAVFGTNCCGCHCS